jgi:tetratricopeptide (TPR) repeat protein
MRYLGLLLLAAGALPTAVLSEPSPPQSLQEAYSLQQQGQYDKVIEILPSLVESSHITPLQRGQAFTVLAFAFEMEGIYNKASDSYEQALRILEKDDAYASDYAIALENFANLYKDVGQRESALNIQKKALALFQKLNDVDGMARSSVSLANLEIQRKKLREGAKYLSMSRIFAAQSPGMDPDYYADFNSTRARFDELSGDTNAALSEYQKALDTWKIKHGPEHMITGWGYMLLGSAEDRAGQEQNALKDMREGMTVLRSALGANSPKYLLAEVAYSRALIRAGETEEGNALLKQANEELTALLRDQCLNCRVDISALD